MKNSLGLVLASLMVSASVSAGPNYLPSGSSLTYGSAGSAGDAMVGVSNNPAIQAYSSRKYGQKDDMSTNLWSSGSYIEFGPVDNLMDDINTLTDILEKDNLTLDEATDLQTQANNILKKIGDNGYFQGGGSLHVPMFPITVNSLGGSVVYDFNSSLYGYGRLLDDPVALNQINNSIGSASSLYAKGAVMHELSMSYSRYLMEALGGSFYAGIRAKLLSVGLTKSVIRLDGLGQKDAGNAIFDELTGTNLNTSSGFGLDAGVVFALENASFGLTFTNINSPSFAYGTLGGDCSTKTGTEQTNCNAANTFSNEIALEEKHTMNSQAKIDASYDTSKNGWRFITSYDLNAVLDPVGNQIQNFDISAVSLGSSTFRAGLTKNMKGTSLTWLGLGMTLWDVVQWDIAFPLEFAKIGDASLPRGFKSTFGIEVSF